MYEALYDNTQPCIIRIEDMYDTMDTLYIVLEL